MKKTYQSFKSVQAELELYIKALLAEGSTLLPPERLLSETLNCSRKTLRLVLGELEKRGDVVKGAHGRSLTVSAVDENKYEGALAFVTCGEGDVISNPPWAKLADAVKTQARRRNLKLETVLLSYDSDNQERLKALADDFEVLVMTNAPSLQLRDEILALPGKLFLNAEEHWEEALGNLIATDNYLTGLMAAEALAKSGYTRPAFLSSKTVSGGRAYVPFLQRAAGFRDGCSRFGLVYGEEDECWEQASTKYELIINYIKRLELIKTGDYDSLFLVADQDVDFVYASLALGKKVPEQFGLVTQNSLDLALCHVPPISAVGNGINEVAEAIVAAACGYFKNGEKDIGRVMITPGFHEGKTLR